MAGSLVWISSTGFAEPSVKKDHAGSDTTTGSTSTASETTEKPKSKPEVDAKNKRTAALKRMKEVLQKTSNTTLRQFTGQIAQFQKVDPDILGGIVDKLPDLNEDFSKDLKDTFKEVFPELGETADADLNRVVAQLLADRFGDDKKDGDTGKNDGKTENEKVREAIDKALAAKTEQDKKDKEAQKSDIKKFTDDLNKQLDDLFKASNLAKNDLDKAKNALGNLPTDLGQQNAGNETPTDSGSGSGSGSGGGGSPSGGGDDKGGNTPKDTASKEKPAKKELSALKLESPKSSESKAATPAKEEEFKIEKKKEAEKPATIPTGASKTAATEPPPVSDVVDPSQGLGQTRPQLAGSGSAASGIAPSSSSLADNSGGGAGIQINGASASPLSSGDGDVGAGLGVTQQPAGEERGRFFYQRTGDKDWVSSGGTNEESYASGSDGSDSSYAIVKPGPTLASLGLTPSRDESASQESFGVFSASPLKKLCKSNVGVSVGICTTRAIKASSSGKAPARQLGSLYEKAKASGMIPTL